MRLFICFFLLALLWVQAAAQKQEGHLLFIGHHFLNGKPLLFTEVKVVSGNRVVSKMETGPDHHFKIQLSFGKVYDLYFNNASIQPMFIRVCTDIPVDQQQINATYELDIPFFARDPEQFDTAQFRNPIHRIVFDGRSRFVDDTVYMHAFLKKVVRQRKDDTLGLGFVKQARVNQVQLVGRLSLMNDKRTLLKHKTVSLIGKDGRKLAETHTTTHGIFVFRAADASQADGIRVELPPADNPNGAAVKLQTPEGDALDSAGYQAAGYCLFQRKNGSELISRLADNDYRYNIGGKILVELTGRRLASETEVRLLNDKGVQIQKTKTDVFGNFLLTKIAPGQRYLLAFDTAAYHAAPELYTLRDKIVGKADSLSGRNYLYPFIAGTDSRSEDLLIDDVELKMHVRGRLYGDNKNNPLSDLKVLLLNDKYRVIDSALTDREGDFEFMNKPYTRRILFNAENEKNILEAFNNILVFDNTENLIKIVSNVKGSKFAYKPLATEQSRLTEVVVNEPWLAVLNARHAPNDKVSVIIEDILFAFDKADLLPQARQTLDKIILAMKMNQHFAVELGAHTDSKGSDAYNLKLSAQRAESARAYMIAHGVDAARIAAKGYGESKLLNNCTDALRCSEDEHAVNRRIEFKLTFTD